MKTRLKYPSWHRIPRPRPHIPARPAGGQECEILSLASPEKTRKWLQPKKKLKYPPPPPPTREQVDEFAIAIAIDDNIVDKHILRLICWRPGDSLAGIPERTLRNHFHAAQRRWTDARLLLEKCRQENHALRVRYIRRFGNRNWMRYWTTKPLKHGRKPPPRRRMGYVPPTTRNANPTATPPGAIQPGEALHGQTHQIIRENPLFDPGGGRRPSVLRPCPDGTPSKQCITLLFDN